MMIPCVPELPAGDRLTRDEFERRHAALLAGDLPALRAAVARGCQGEEHAALQRRPVESA